MNCGLEGQTRLRGLRCGWFADDVGVPGGGLDPHSAQFIRARDWFRVIKVDRPATAATDPMPSMENAADKDDTSNKNAAETPSP